MKLTDITMYSALDPRRWEVCSTRLGVADCDSKQLRNRGCQQDKRLTCITHGNLSERGDCRKARRRISSSPMKDERQAIKRTASAGAV